MRGTRWRIMFAGQRDPTRLFFVTNEGMHVVSFLANTFCLPAVAAAKSGFAYSLDNRITLHVSVDNRNPSKFPAYAGVRGIFPIFHGVKKALSTRDSLVGTSRSAEPYADATTPYVSSHDDRQHPRGPLLLYLPTPYSRQPPRGRQRRRRWARHHQASAGGSRT